jgi:hypothetical protein
VFGNDPVSETRSGKYAAPQTDPGFSAGHVLAMIIPKRAPHCRVNPKFF